MVDLFPGPQLYFEIFFVKSNALAEYKAKTDIWIFEKKITVKNSQKINIKEVNVARIHFK